jgi:DNA-binding NarL/FixJ family response regulator
LIALDLLSHVSTIEIAMNLAFRELGNGSPLVSHNATRRLLERHPRLALIYRPEIWSAAASVEASSGRIFTIGIDEWLRQGIEVQINNPAFQIVPCESCQQLSQNYDATHACAVVTTLELWDDMDAEERRTTRSRVKSPFIFISESASAGAVAAAFRSGAFEVLMKPLSLETLRDRILIATSVDLQRIVDQKRTVEVRLRFEGLTDREQEIMLLVAQGMSLKQIGAYCDISFQTVAKHRTKILKKMDVNNDVELALLVRNHLAE